MSSLATRSPAGILRRHPTGDGDVLAGAGDFHGRAGRAHVYALGTISAAAEVHGAVAVGPSDLGLLRGDDSDRHALPTAGRTDHSAFARRRAGRKRRRRRRRAPTADPKDQPWETFPNDAVAQPAEAALERGKADLPVEPKRLVRARDTRLPGDLPLDAVAVQEAKPASAKATLTKSRPRRAIRRRRSMPRPPNAARPPRR